MMRLGRGRWVLGAFVALTSTTWAASSATDEFLQRKHDAIQPHAEKTLSDRYGPLAFEASLMRSTAVTGVSVDDSSMPPQVGLELSQPTALSIEKSDRTLTVDMFSTVLLEELEQLNIQGNAQPLQVKLTQISTDPQFVTRATIISEQPFSVRVDEFSSSLKFVFTAPSAELDESLRALSASFAGDVQASARTEYAARNRSTLERVEAEYHRATEEIAESAQSGKMKLLQADLAGFSPTSAKTSIALNADLETMQSRTESIQRTFANHNRMYHQIVSASVPADAFDVIAMQTSMDKALAGMEKALAGIQAQSEIANIVLGQVAQITTGTLQHDASLTDFDSALAALRTDSSKSADDKDHLDAFDTALLTVSDAATLLPVEEATVAALHEANTATMPAPPARRYRPAPNSLTSSSIANPDLMVTMAATSQELDSAANQGMLVLAQANTSDVVTNESRPEPKPADASAYQPRRIQVMNRTTRPDFNLYNENLPADEDPLRALVNIDFKDMDLANVVALLAQKGQINVIAGTEISGSVTANLKEIPLGRAIEIVLRMNSLGIVEESGVYRITTYEEAVASRQDTEMVFLQNAEAQAVKETLEEVTQNSGGGGRGQRIRIGANTQSNIIVISGPREEVNEIIDIIQELDIAEPVIPTQNRVIQLNYALPEDIAKIIEPILSENGQVTPEVRAGQIVLTDIPVKVAELSALIKELDVPVEQVSIEAMILDHAITDNSDSGTNWNVLTSSLLPQAGSERFNAGVSSAPAGAVGSVGFGFVADNLELGAMVNAQVESGNTEIIANPTIVTVENKAATINITQEYPYRTVRSSGNTETATVEFKEIGTILEVVPKITFDGRIRTDIIAEQSNIVGFVPTNLGDVPIEAKRLAETTMRMNNGQTVYIAGLRRYDTGKIEAKVPILGDIPILGFFFKSQGTDLTNTELLIFLTCNIIEDDFNELTPYEKRKFDRLGGITEDDIDSTPDMLESYGTNQMRDPIYKWRRPK